MRIIAELQSMAESEIMNMISADRLNQIKAVVSHPIFKVYTVGHEGEEKGRILGIGKVIKQWFKSAIEKLHQKIQIGTKLFQGHGVTNDTEGRIPIGEVVGKEKKNINGRDSVLVACWVYPDYENLPLDVASIEAAIDVRDYNGNGIYVADIDQVSGIALGNSRVNTPGFPGATLQGVLQAFAEKHPQYQGGDMTLSELRKAVEEGKYQPSEIYGKDTLLSDPLIKDEIREKTNAPTHYRIRELERENETIKKAQEEAEKKVKDFEKKLTDKDNEVKTLKTESIKSKIPTLLEKQIKERKLDKEKDLSLINWLNKKVKDFTPENEEDIEKELSKRIDNEIDEFKTYSSEVFGIKIEEDKNKPGGSEPDLKTPAKPADKYLDPKTNPLINPTPGR